MSLSKPSNATQRHGVDCVIAVAVLALAALAVWPGLFAGWMYMDDGGMAQVAHRVLLGELPHRDFTEPWTGGWSYFQAAIFGLFGESLGLLRLPIFGAWLLGVLLVIRLARYFVSSAVAALVALLCAEWSLFQLHLPLLNWFFFPLALFSGWAVARREDSERWWWMVVAGAGVGVAILVKITGLFILAALLIWCLVRAGERVRGSEEPRSLGYAAMSVAVLAVFVLMVYSLVNGLPREVLGSSRVHFLLPSVGLALWALLRVYRGRRSATAGAAQLLTLVSPLLLGVLVAIAPFLWYYVHQNAVPSLWDGVFVRPRIRLGVMSYGPPGRLPTLEALCAPALLLFASQWAAGEDTPRERKLSVLLGVVWGAALIIGGPIATDVALLSLRSIPILLPLLALWWDLRRDLPPLQGSRAFLLVALAVLSQLVQVPYATNHYFFYVAPIGIVALWALVGSLTRTRRSLLLFWGAFLLVVGTGTSRAAAPSHWAVLPFRRAGIEVSPEDSATYAWLAAVMRRQPAGPIFVLGDSPEVPFLLERESAGQAIYDVTSDASERDTRSMLERLRGRDVRTVIIRRDGGTRDLLYAAQRVALRREFPNVVSEFPFEVRWRDTALKRSVPPQEVVRMKLAQDNAQRSVAKRK